jgi:N-acetylmuramoyl-L-alanine amidase
MTADKPAEAPARALRSVDAPAVAIEIGSLTPDLESGALTDPNFQQQVANAIAAGLEAWRGGAS